ncbi:MAG: TonB-dependent receptor, partial [Bacteroidota bacterium]|nr:TonB-dependent receptor [Bacteroidota bacterium]
LNYTPLRRQVILTGFGAEILTSSHTNMYANFSQSFRPVTYSELTPSATTEIIDPDLKDAKGYNFDIGFRGKIKESVHFDIGGFYVYYDQRIGTVTLNNLPFKTNIGTSVSKGIESFVEFSPVKLVTDQPAFGNVNLFVSFTYVNATYTKWNNPALFIDPKKSIQGKKVENAPEIISRVGINYTIKKFSTSIQWNYVGEVYTDAVNTELASGTATTGLIPSYKICDVSASYVLKVNYLIKAGINNLTNQDYATRRASGYPGPGLMPGNGRSGYVSFGVKF